MTMSMISVMSMMFIMIIISMMSVTSIVVMGTRGEGRFSFMVMIGWVHYLGSVSYKK